MKDTVKTRMISLGFNHLYHEGRLVHPMELRSATSLGIEDPLMLQVVVATPFTVYLECDDATRREAGNRKPTLRQAPSEAARIHKPRRWLSQHSEGPKFLRCFFNILFLTAYMVGAGFMLQSSLSRTTDSRITELYGWSIYKSEASAF